MVLGVRTQWLWNIVTRFYERNLPEDRWKGYSKGSWDVFNRYIFFSTSCKAALCFEWVNCMKECYCWKCSTHPCTLFKGYRFKVNLPYCWARRNELPACQSAFLMKDRLNKYGSESTLIISFNSDRDKLFCKF